MSRRAITLPLVAAGVGLALGLVQAVTDPRRALFAYTLGFAFALTIALGSLVFVMITHTARARWFVVLRRITMAAASTLPLFLVLFVPIALGARHLYPWAGPPGDLDAQDRAWVDHVRPWLNVPFFVVRSYVYLGVWSWLSLALRTASLSNDTKPDESRVRRERALSAGGLPLMAFTLTFAGFDWVMSLDARWASDMMGVYLFAGALGASVGVTAIATFFAVRARLLPAEVGPTHFHALGRVLFMTVVFWAYIGFCQFLLVWMADLERESLFYAERVRDGWQAVAAVLVGVHFVLPFLFLLPRSVKEAPTRLALAGATLVVAHALDLYWLVLPPLHAGLRPLDPAFLVAIAAGCTAFGVFRFLGSSAIPLHDPALAESLRYESP